MPIHETAHPNHALSAAEDSLLSDELAGQRPLVLLRSKTRVDTGRWLRKSPLWLCVTETDILLLAASKRRYVQRMPIADCETSQYCHTSGALLLQPSDAWRFNAIHLPPADALKVLRHLDRATPSTQNPPVTEPTGA
jgi:hypothetical protein